MLYNGDSIAFVTGFPRVVALYPLSKRTKGKDISGNRNPNGQLSGVYPAPGPDEIGRASCRERG